MGGKNVLMVMDDADIDLAVDGAIWGGFGTSGQRCTAASRVVVHKKVIGEFTRKFVERASKLRVGDGLDPTVDVGPVINEAQLARIQQYVRIGQGGRRDAALRRQSPGYGSPQEWLVPRTDHLRRCRSEHAHCAGGNIRACRFDHSLQQSGRCHRNREWSEVRPFGARSIRATSIAHSGRCATCIPGIFYVNSSTIGAEVHLPFGGTKSTGNGHREAGTAALDVFSEWKSIYVDYSGKLQKAQGIE